MNGNSTWSNSNSFCLTDGKLPFLFEYGTPRASVQR